MTSIGEAPQSSHAFTRVRQLIADGRFDLVSFDVFDTLVWRPVAAPHHLFVDVGRRLIGRGLLAAHVTLDDFVAGRRRAELRARAAVLRSLGLNECTLDEIWQQMPLEWLIDVTTDRPESRSVYVETEIDVECSHLRPHGEACSVLQSAHDAGIKTALVSDTYFTADQLRRLLASAGVPLAAVGRLDVSCEARMAKHEGLLARVIAECVADPGRALHIGDNPIADVESAAAAGAVAVLADVDERWAPAVLAAVRTYSSRSGDDMGVTALTRETLLAAGEDGQRADYQFGATVGAPVLHGFARWIAAMADELGVDTVHCLLREGGVIADLVDIARPGRLRAVPVHASRWVNLRAAVLTGTPEELFRALARKAPMEASHVSAAFGVDPRLVNRVIGSAPLDDLGRADAIERISDDDELRSAIIDASARLRVRLLRYLDAVLTPTDGRLVVCDVGWGGTIQEALQDVLVHEGRIRSRDHVTGLYLMLSQSGIERRLAGQRLLSYLPARSTSDRELAVIARNPELLEQLCTPDQGTLLDIDEHGAPITAAHDPTMTPSRHLAQRALFDGVRALAGFSPHRTEPDDGRSVEPDPWLDAGLRSQLLSGLATTLQAPTAGLARSLVGWLHDDIAGEAVVPLADTAQLGFLSFVNAAEIAAIDMRDVFWLPGAAATNNPTLVEQLAAVQRGADAELLCPATPAGQVSIAVFAPDSDEAVALTRPIARTGVGGWSYIRLSASVAAVRAVRIDFGDCDHLVELDHLDIVFNADESTTWHIERVDDDRLRWHGGRVVSPSLAAVGSGGYLLAPVAGSTLEATKGIEIRCAFRASPLGPDDAAALLQQSMSASIRAQAQRAVASARSRGRQR